MRSSGLSSSLGFESERRNINPSGSVQLADHHSASTILHSILLECVAAYPNAFRGLVLPESAKSFRRQYPDLLPLFEASRLASPERGEIARYLCASMQDKVVWQEDSGDTVALHRFLETRGAPLELDMSTPDGEPGWRPAIPFDGRVWTGDECAEFGAHLLRRHFVSEAAAQSLRWIGENVIDDGRVRLSGRKLVLLGAGAEMAPTRLLLEAGADILWLDITAPPPDLFTPTGIAGRLYWPTQNVDVLTAPHDVLATIVAFSDGDPVDIGLYAYAPGQAREVRLTAAMNAIVDAMPASVIRSVTMLVSPTSPTALDAASLAAMEARLASRPAWEAALSRIGVLGGSGCARIGAAAATRTVVGIQGASYQAAQYLGKLMMAEAWAHHGITSETAPAPLRVSANTAAITQTRSLQHPVFAAAFRGADALGVETFTPQQSRQINGLLAVCDWLRPDAPEPAKVRVHGGIHTLPYSLESALRVAAALGFVRSPGLLAGLIRGS